MGGVLHLGASPVSVYTDTVSTTSVPRQQKGCVGCGYTWPDEGDVRIKTLAVQIYYLRT